MANGFDVAAPLGPGEGNAEMIIADEGGRVILRFREPMLYVAMDPGNAVQIGKTLIDAAVRCGMDVRIEVPRREVSDATRVRLIKRASIILRSLREKGRSPEHTAAHVVDAVLREIA